MRIIWSTLIVLGILYSLASACAAEQGGLEKDAFPDNGTACERVRLLPKEQNRCSYVKQNCDSDSFIPYLKIYYCHAKPAGVITEAGFQLLCGFLLVLIFRLLGSTAEDFFSPILTQISQDMGLPPRFAGVTLLALGNGAPDLVACIAFIRAGKYNVAMSGLLGGGMFVGAVVAGCVILVAQGVKARGALLRDVSSYLLAVGVVAALFRSGSMTWSLAIFLLALYLLFVALVLAADIAHIWKHRHRGEEPLEKPPERRPLLADVISQPPEADLPQAGHGLASAPSIELTEGQPSTVGSEAADPVSWSHSHSGGRDSTWSAGEGAHLTYNEKVHMSGRTYRQMALAEIAHSNTFFGNSDMETARQAAISQETEDQAEQGYAPPEQVGEADVLGERQAGGTAASSSGAAQEDRQARVQRWCSEGHDFGPRGSGEAASGSGRPPGDGHGALSLQSIQGRVPAALLRCWRATGAGFRVLQTVFDVAEYPLLLLRKVTIPLVDSDSYSRSWLIATAVGAPLAILWYCGWMSWIPTIVVLALSAGVAAAAAHFTVQEKAPEWSCGLPFPVGVAAVAAIGFIVSAMWIDTIAGELVSLLDYFGTLSGIPHEVLGLTVLAWGNSVGDLSTNMAMARRGLSNMAMTACFAGPIFNLLMAMGLGFIRLFASSHIDSAGVSLQAVDVPAVVLIFVNGLLLMLTGILHNSWVPGWYGVVPLVLYALYIAISLAVAFG